MSSSVEESEDLDPRTHQQKEYDAVADLVRQSTGQVIELTELVKSIVETTRTGQNQRVTYRVEGMGAVGIICSVVCVLCVLLVIAIVGIINIEFARQDKASSDENVRVQAELHDLRAWRDIHQNHISAIEAREEKRK